jgi:hypothetical protein
MMALAEGKWTAASLGTAFAWAFSVVLVTMAGALGLFLARSSHKDSRASH